MRTKEKFNQDWKFYLGDINVRYAVKSGMTGGFTDISNLEKGIWLDIAFADKTLTNYPREDKWEDVKIPHDFMITKPFENDNSLGSRPAANGYKRGDVGFYRKSFLIPENDNGKRISIIFDGVFRDCKVWINGHLFHGNKSGYTGFECDVTDVLRYGNEGVNIISLRVDATEYEGWWYEGGGIYRNVWIEKTSQVYFPNDDIFVKNIHADKNLGIIEIENCVVNESYKDFTGYIKQKIISADRNTVWEKRAEISVEKGRKFNYNFHAELKTPYLWSDKTPFLYTYSLELYELQGELVDNFEITFGIRDIRFDREKGFFLNGEHTVIKGVCVHQDFFGVGVALTESIIEYRLKILKDMGCNAYRSAHHPATEEVLNCCDKLGIMVMDENRILDVSEYGLFLLKKLVKGHRNHTSIIIWNLENEEILEGTVMGQRMVSKMSREVKKYDDSRPVCVGMNHGWDTEYSKDVDLTGYNYGQRFDSYITDFYKFPERKFIMSEAVSATTTRGVYINDSEIGYCSEYNDNLLPWACTPYNAWKDLIKYPHLCGIFVWTAFDYKGEPSPYEWPCINSHTGFIDIAGNPKDSFYYYKAMWDSKPIVHILPHWNFSEDEMVRVFVYTNCERVEIFKNEKLIHKQKVELGEIIEFETEFEKGEIKALGYIGENNVTEASRITASQPFKLITKANKKCLNAAEDDCAIITVKVVDEGGNIVPNADNLVTFETEGPIQIIGVGNGNPSSHEPDKGDNRKAFNGICNCIVQSFNSSGMAKLFVKSEKLISSELEFMIQEKN